MEQPENKPFSSKWYDEMWGKIVIGIGAGKGRDELVTILQYVARERFEAGVEWAKTEDTTQ